MDVLDEHTGHPRTKILNTVSHLGAICAARSRGAGGSAKEGGQVINGYLIPAEWGTSVHLGSVKRGPRSGCTDPGL